MRADPIPLGSADFVLVVVPVADSEFFSKYPGDREVHRDGTAGRNVGNGLANERGTYQGPT